MTRSGSGTRGLRSEVASSRSMTLRTGRLGRFMGKPELSHSRGSLTLRRGRGRPLRPGRRRADFHKLLPMEETEDLNRLIQDLNTGVRREATGDTGRLERWLAGLTERGGSDLLLVA